MKIILYNENYEKIETIHFVRCICSNNKGLVYELEGDTYEETQLIYKFDYWYYHIYKEY